LKKNVNIDIQPDIICSPCGYNGFYQLGICHYIKNNFYHENKTKLGFSSGSWVTLFMCLKNEYSTECIRRMFIHTKKSCLLTQLPNIFKSVISKYEYNDFNISKLYIGMTNIHKKNIYVHNEFLTLNDCIQCCIGSSFVPYVTYKEFIYFYKHKFVIDGGVYYKNYIKNIDKTKVLVINSSLFRENYKKRHEIFKGFIKPKCSLYDLYVKGYNNARKNHAYLKQYFHSDS
jgi:hypothetical protein